MNSLTSSFQIHSPSILTPTESASSLLAFLTLADHPIIPLDRFELVEEMEENVNKCPNPTSSNLEQCLLIARRGAEQSGVAKLLSL